MSRNDNVLGIRLKGVTKIFRTGKEVVTAVDELSLEVGRGEIVALLGPSGCGKTTTLRCLAGLERPDEGEIMIGDRVVSSSTSGVFIPPERRRLGMVFQSYAVWPHMTVFTNVAYPLQQAKTSRGTINELVLQVLELVGIHDLKDRYPGELSGGQQQRVALARALVTEPEVVLFDEPLSNLDWKLRERMRFELVSLQQSKGFSAVYVTHDQVEAMTVANRIAVMESGKVLQLGNPTSVYEKPVSRAVADFMGTPNFLPGTCAKSTAGTKVVACSFGEVEVNNPEKLNLGHLVDICVRPEVIELTEDNPENQASYWPGQVKQAAYLGQQMAYIVDLAGCSLKVYGRTAVKFEPGTLVFVHFPADKVATFDRETAVSKQ